MPPAERRVAPDPQPARCRGQDCTHPPYARGLCRGHYLRQPAGEPEDLSPLGRYRKGSGQLAVRLPGDLIATLRANAAASGASLTEVVESALRRGLTDT